MHPFYLEAELIHPVKTYFQHQGYRVYEEQRLGFRIADIVGIKKNTVIAVELKLRDYKTALAQAKTYQLAADYVFLAFPLMQCPRVLRKCEHILHKEGIGLLGVHEETCEIRELIKAMVSQRKMTSLTQKELHLSSPKKKPWF